MAFRARFIALIQIGSFCQELAGLPREVGDGSTASTEGKQTEDARKARISASWLPKLSWSGISIKGLGDQLKTGLRFSPNTLRGPLAHGPIKGL